MPKTDRRSKIIQSKTEKFEPKRSKSLLGEMENGHGIGSPSLRYAPFDSAKAGATRGEIADYIADLLISLRDMATTNDLDHLAILLEEAHQEASSQKDVRS